MQLTPWYLIVTAIAIPLGNALFAGILGLVAAHVGKNATQYAANLAAAQRRRDTEIAQLERSRDDLITAATAIQSYVWYVDKSVRLNYKISKEDWENSRPFFEPAVNGAQRLQAIAKSLPTEALRDAYIEVERLIMTVVKGSDDGQTDPWSEATDNQPDPITRAMDATADEIKRLYAIYPDGGTGRSASQLGSA